MTDEDVMKDWLKKKSQKEAGNENRRIAGRGKWFSFFEYAGGRP